MLVDRGLVPSRERGQALILAGRVLVDEQKVEKAGAAVANDATIRILGDDLPYVSRGGLKLEHALHHWSIDVAGKLCMDVGASTGGFTDCLLQNGASRVIAVDTGYGQMDIKVRSDDRVHLLEKTNARLSHPGAPLAERCATLSRSACSSWMFPSSRQRWFCPLSSLACELREPRSSSSVVLVKPQFEVGRELVGKGGIVRDPEAQQAAVHKVAAAVEQLGGKRIEWTDSPILGAEGNREFLLHAVFEQV